MPNDQLAFITRDVTAKNPIGLRIPALSPCRIVGTQPNNLSVVDMEVRGQWKSAVVANDAIAMDTMHCEELGQWMIDDGGWDEGQKEIL